MRAWLWDAPRGIAGHLIFAGCLLGICGSAAYVGVPWLFKYSADSFLFLDGGWRLLQGQRPHVDFYTAIGPVTYLINALGLKLAGYEPWGLGLGSAIFGLLIGLWTYRISVRRMRYLAASVASLFLVLLAVGPFPLGESPTETGFAMVYNRYGYALLGLVIIESYKLVRPAKGETREVLFGCLSTGIALGVLLFLKVSFFLGGLPLIVPGLLWRPRPRVRMAGAILLGFAAACLVFFWYLRFNLSAMWGDLLMTAHARQPSISAIRAVLLSDFDVFGLIVLLVLARALEGLRPKEAGRFLRQQRLTIGALATVLVGYFLLLTNHQSYGLPLNALFAILIAEEIPSLGSDVSASALRIVCSASVLAVALLVAIPTAGSDLISLGYSVVRQARTVKTLGASMASTEPRLRGLWFVGEYPRCNTVDYLHDLEDGLALVRRSSGADETVYSLDFSNPFAYFLGRQVAPGGSWSIAYKQAVDDRHHPAAGRIFGGVDIVMEPKFPVVDLTGTKRIYGNYLRAHFRLAAESRSWLMYRRFE